MSFAKNEKDIESVIIPDSITTIGDYAFASNKLTNKSPIVVIPSLMITLLILFYYP